MICLQLSIAFGYPIAWRNSKADDQALVNDLVLAGGRGNVDHFLVGPYGLSVLETKNWSGGVQCSSGQWFHHGREVRSLSRQPKFNAVFDRKLLNEKFKDSQRIPFVVPVLAFVDREAYLELYPPTVSYHLTSLPRVDGAQM